MNPQKWLPSFFEAGNKINLKKVLEKGYSLEFQMALAPLIEPAWNGNTPIILPYSTGTDLFFYGAAVDERSIRELYRVLGASLGTADIYPDMTIINHPENSAENVLLSVYPHGVVRLQVSLDNIPSKHLEESVARKHRTFETLGSVISLFNRRPEIISNQKRPIGAILKDFFVACHAQDGERAHYYFDEITRGAVLSQRNLKFLKLQLYASKRQWNAITNYESLPDIMLGRIPTRVQRLLVRVMGHELLNHLQREGFVEGTFDKSRRYCMAFQPFLARVPAFPHEPSFGQDWKLWALGATSVGFSPWPLLPSFIEKEWLESAKQWSGFVDNAEHQLKDALIASGASQRILTIDGASKLIQKTLDPAFDLSEIVDIVDMLISMPDQTRQELERRPGLNLQWQWLQSQVKSEETLGWTTWFQTLFASELSGRDFNKLYQEAVEFSDGWLLQSFDESEIELLLDKGLKPNAELTLRNALPLLLAWLDEREVQCGPKLLCALIDLLALDDTQSDEDLRLAYLLLERMLKGAFTLASYVQSLDAIEILINGASPRALSYASDIAELLLESQCPQVEKRRQVWNALQSEAINKWNRLQEHQRLIFHLLAEEYTGFNGDNIFPISKGKAEHDSQNLPNLSNKLLAIYSLTEGAARRAKVTLESMFDGLKVELNHDHEHTSALANLAKRSDYFIFAWGSSKHQAYFAIKKYRSDLLYPVGKGATSIINSILLVVT